MYTSGIPQSETIYAFYLILRYGLDGPMFAVNERHVSVSKWIGNIRLIVKYLFLSEQLMAGDQNMFRILGLLSAHIRSKLSVLLAHITR